jgi:hypothetical protein
MAQGKWVNIPGKGRRWQQPSGELMMEKPGIGFVQAQLSPVTGFLGSIFKSSGLPAYQMSGPGLQQLRQQQTQDYYRQRGLSSLGPEYKEQELAAGAVAERSRPGAGFPDQQGMFTPAAPGPGTSSPAVLDPYAAQNRAYQQERARVEAMVKANPDMQKQEIADARAKVRDQGMATWAAANSTLAKNLQPGQVGYGAVQQALVGNEAGQAARMGYGYQMPQQMLTTPPPGVNAPQGLPGVSSFGAASGYGEQGLEIDPEMAKKFQALLNQAQK